MCLEPRSWPLTHADHLIRFVAGKTWLIAAVFELRLTKNQVTEVQSDELVRRKSDCTLARLPSLGDLLNPGRVSAWPS